MARQQKLSLFGQFTPTGVDQTVGSNLRALAGLTKQVGDIAFQVGAKQQANKGMLAGKKAGFEAAEKGEGLQVKEAGLFSIFDESYNNSMRSSYLASIDNDNKEKFAQIASDNPTDLKTFTKLTGEYVKGVMQNTDEEARLLIEESMNKTISNLSIKIREAEKQKNLTEADNNQQIAIQNNIDASLGYAFDGDFQQAAGSLIIAQQFNDARLASGKISSVEHDKTNTALINSVDIEANRSQFDNMLDANKIDKIIGFLQKVSDNTIPGKTPDEHRNLLSILQTDMDKHYRLIDRVEAELTAREVEKQEINNEKLFISTIEGRTTASMVILAMKTNSISTPQGEALLTQINTRGVGIDDHSVIIEINELMRGDPKAAKLKIIENMGKNLTGDTSERLINSANNILDTGTTESPLNTNKAKRFRSLLRAQTFKGNEYGFGSLGENQKLSELQLVFDERVLDGENPALVAKDLLDVDEFINLPRPTFGDNSDPQDSLDQLNEFIIKQKKLDDDRQMSDDDYILQANRLHRAIQLIKLKEDFDQAFKEALDGE